MIARALLIVSVLATAGCSSPAPSKPPTTVDGYRVVADVPLPGDTSRWDYQAVDPTAGRLYLAHLGAGEIVVLELQRRTVIGVVKNVAGVHGLVVVPELRRLFASATGTHEVVAVDTDALRIVGRAPAGDYPDGLDYASSTGRLFVSDEHGAGDVVIDAATMRPLGGVKLGSDIGNSKYDPGSNLVYVAVGGTNEIVAVDPSSDSVRRRMAVGGCQGAHGLQLAGPARAFVGCEDNGRVVAYDLEAGRVIGQFSAGSTPDVLAYDAGLRRVYIACEDGTVAIISATESPRELRREKAGPDAHTVAVDPATHLVYLPLTNVGGHPVLRVLAPQ